MNNLLIDSGSLEHCVDARYSLSSINKNAYKVLKLKVGTDQSIIVCSGITPKELNTIKTGKGSIALLQRTFSNLFMQFITAYTDNDTVYRCRVKCAFKVYRLTP